MPAFSDKSRSGRQRYKAALIPVLALALAALVFWPEPADPAGSRAPSPPPAAATPASLAADAAAPSAAGDDAWPQMELAAITAVNPFVRPPAVQRLFEEPISPPATASLAGLASEAVDSQPPLPATDAPLASPPAAEPPPVESVKLQAILASGGERTALIDSRIVRAGETLPSGYRVVEITRTGLVMEFVAADGQPQPLVTRSLP